MWMMDPGGMFGYCGALSGHEGKHVIPKGHRWGIITEIVAVRT